MENQEQKSKFQQAIDVITGVAKITIGAGIVHCKAQDEQMDGRYIT